MTWSEERVELLERLWDEGYSAGQIAARMHGLTRNAVLGKVHRLGLKKRKAASRVKPAHKRPRKRKNNSNHPWAPPSSPPVNGGPPTEPDGHPSQPLPASVPVPSSNPRTVLTIATYGECRWPVSGEHEDTVFCGAPCDPTGPYCETHHAIAYVAPPKATRKPSPASKRAWDKRARQRKRDWLERQSQAT